MAMLRWTALLMLLLAGCVGSDPAAPVEPNPSPAVPIGPSAPADASPAPSPPAPPGDGAEISGTLGGDAQLEGGCVWLDTPDGRIEPQWPAGYATTVDPVALVGPGGDVVAEQGDRVTVTGAPAHDVMSICQVGAIWTVTEVEVAGD